MLKVYAIYDEELGYCQGMGFIAGMFLMHLGEEDAFWMLVMVMKGNYNMRGLYSHGMALVNLRCYQLKRLLEKRHPRLVQHLVCLYNVEIVLSWPLSHVRFRFQESEHVDIQSLSMQWFITNFSYNLPFRVLLRIWDVFLLEHSPKILFRVAIYFFDELRGIGMCIHVVFRITLCDL